MTLLRNNALLEDRVLKIAAAVKSGTMVEDSLVELKTAWPAPEGAFRQLAGHANAARGDNILWVIGIDEKTRSVPGASGEELSVWWPQVQKRFESTSPDLIRHLNVQFEGVSVQALLFGTDRAPYVVHASVKPEAEVPWRDGTRTRSAKRHELLSLLTEDAGRLEIEFRSGMVMWRPDYVFAEATLYIVGAPGRIYTFPEHRCVWSIRQDGQEPWDLSGNSLRLGPKDAQDQGKSTVHRSGSQLFVEGSGYVTLTISQQKLIPIVEAQVHVEISLEQAHSTSRVTLRFTGQLKLERSDYRQWVLSDPVESSVRT